MKNLERITKLKLPKIKDFNMYYYQSEIQNHLFLEFFFKKSRFIITPKQEILTTGQFQEDELSKATIIVESNADKINTPLS